MRVCVCACVCVQADLVVNLEADKVTKEMRKVDLEQDEGSERAPMMIKI